MLGNPSLLPLSVVLDGRQPEPLNVNIDELQSVHHAAQGPGPKQEPMVKGGKGKGKKGEKGGKGDSPSDPQPKSSDASGKGSGKGDSPAVPKAKAKANAGPAQWRLIHLWLNRRRLGLR